MKKLLAFLALPLALFGATPVPVNLQATGDANRLLLQDFHIGSARTVTIDSGGTFTVSAGAFFNFPAGFIAWADVSKSGSSLADLTTRSAGDLSSGTLPNGRFPATLPAANGSLLTNLNASALATGTVATARLYTTAVGYNITGGAALDAIAGLTPTGSQFLQRNSGNSAYQWATISPTITLGGDLTGSATLTNLTSQTLTATATKVNGVAYGASPSTNTVPVVTGANTVTYEAVPNAALANSAITIGGASTALGGAVTATTILDSVGSTRGSLLERGAAGWAIVSPGTATYVLTSNGAGADPSYQQISLSAASITGVLLGVNGGTGVANTGKTITLGGNLTTAGAFNTTLTVTAATGVTLPTSGTLVGSADTGTVTNTMLAGSIANVKLSNSTVTIGSTVVSLGNTAATITGLTLTTPVINNGLTATGTVANDFSGSTGTFKTSSGANTFEGAVTIDDATTPSITLASGKTNTGYISIQGKTSGSLKILPADASGQLVVLYLEPQTVGPALLTIPNQGGVARFLVTDTGTVTLSNKTLGASTSVSAAIAFAAGVRQTFAPSATTPGLNTGSHAGDPSTPSNGDIWYDSTGNLLRARVNSATVTLGTGGTVTHTAGALTSGQVVIGNGSADVATNAGLTFAGTVASFTDTTDSSSPSTGGLTTAGGLGVAKKLFVGSSVNILGSVSGSIILLPGASTAQNVTITTAAQTGFDVTLTIPDMAGSAGTFAFLSKIQTWSATQTFSQSLVGSLTTDATSSTTGAFKTAGGMGIAKKLYVGTNLSVGGSTSLTGLITTYNNVATAGEGVADIRAQANITAQTSNATITSYANPAADADYEVSAQMSVTASTVLATTLTVTYTDVGNAARTMVLPVNDVSGTFVTGGAITGAGASIWESPVMHIRAKASTSITILTSAGTFTGVTYSASAVIKKTS